MAWQTVAQASNLNELEALVEDLELPKGTRMRVIIDLKLPLGWAFDFVAAEWLAQGFVPSGMNLIDVWGEGSQGIIELESDPVWLVAALTFIKAHWLALTLAGFALWLIVSSIIITIKLPALLQAPFWLLAGAAIGIVGLTILSRRGKWLEKSAL